MDKMATRRGREAKAYGIANLTYTDWPCRVTPRRRYVAEPDILPFRKSGVVYDELVDIGARSFTSSVILRLGCVVSAPVPLCPWGIDMNVALSRCIPREK